MCLDQENISPHHDGLSCQGNHGEMVDTRMAMPSSCAVLGRITWNSRCQFPTAMICLELRTKSKAGVRRKGQGETELLQHRICQHSCCLNKPSWHTHISHQEFWTILYSNALVIWSLKPSSMHLDGRFKLNPSEPELNPRPNTHGAIRKLRF